MKLPMYLQQNWRELRWKNTEQTWVTETIESKNQYASDLSQSAINICEIF